jgi:lysophospholipase L1-like esterase
MNKIPAFAALLLVTACGGASNPYGPIDAPMRPVIDQPAVHPIKDEVPVFGIGQSNMQRGTEEFGIGQQYARRLQADNPTVNVQYYQAAVGGQNVAQFLNGGRVADVMDSTFSGKTADHLLVHQGEADRGKSSEYWVGTWGTVLGQMETKGYIDGDTNVTFGEVARDLPEYQTRNADMPELAARFGVNIASSKGLATSDGVHFTPEDRNAMGDRYYEAAMK